MNKNMKRMAAMGATTLAFAAFAPLGAAWAGHSNTVLTAELDGRSEVAAADAKSTKRVIGDPNGVGEAYVFGIDGDPTTLCYVLTVDDVQTATAAHIHEGPRGENGPVVVNLAAPADGNAADCLTEGETDKFVGDTTVAEILADPGDYYVNVHNVRYPGGAVRGQLTAER